MKNPVASLSGVSLLMLASVLSASSSARQSEKAQEEPSRKASTQSASQNQSILQPQVLQPKYDLTQAPTNYRLRDLEFFERYCFEEVNRQRQAQNLAPLIFSQDLLPIARQYSRRLAEENFFSHTDPEGRTTRDRLRQAGVKFLLLGENLSQASGYLDPVPDVVQNWMQNPLHRKNILTAEFQYAVVGLWVKDKTFFFTEIFLTK